MRMRDGSGRGVNFDDLIKAHEESKKRLNHDIPDAIARGDVTEVDRLLHVEQDAVAEYPVFG